MVGRGLALAEEQEVAQSLEDVRNQEDGHIHQTALNQEGDRNRDEKDLRALLFQHRIHLLLLIVAVKRNSLSLVHDIEVCHLRSLRKRNDQKVRKSAIDQWNRLVDHIVQLEREIHDTIGNTSKICASKKFRSDRKSKYEPSVASSYMPGYSQSHYKGKVAQEYYNRREMASQSQSETNSVIQSQRVRFIDLQGTRFLVLISRLVLANICCNGVLYWCDWFMSFELAILRHCDNLLQKHCEVEWLFKW